MAAYFWIANAAAVSSAGLAVALLLLPISLLYDWITAGIKPYDQDQFGVLMGLVFLQSLNFCIGSYSFYICFLKQKEDMAARILNHCRSHELLFSYWDRVQTHVWDYWTCYEVILSELIKSVICVAVAGWILWDVTLIILASLLIMIGGCHFASLAFYRGMIELDKSWVSFFERRAYDWVRHRDLLQHYRRWAVLMTVGAKLLNGIYSTSVRRLQSLIFFFSKFSYMASMGFAGTVAPVLIVPSLTSVTSISPKNLWMLASLFSLFVTSAGHIAYSYGKFMVHVERLHALRTELQASSSVHAAQLVVAGDSLTSEEVTATPACGVRSGADAVLYLDAAISQVELASAAALKIDHSDSVELPRAVAVPVQQAITLLNVTVFNGELLVLDGITLQLPLLKRIAIIGPSGSGKTTLLETIMGWRPLRAGSIMINSGAQSDAAATACDMFSYVPAVSSAVIFPTESWRFNLLLEQQGSTADHSPQTQTLMSASSDINSQIAEVLQMLKFPVVDLDAPADRRLSQGEMQRFLLARAFLSELPVVLLDEAFSALSADLRHDLWTRTLRHFTSVIYICHDGASLQQADLAVFVMEGKVELVDPSVNSTHYWVQRMRQADKTGSN